MDSTSRIPASDQDPSSPSHKEAPDPLPDLAPRNLPFVTAAIPGTGGTIRQAPEDFRVEEVPAYEPSGQGDHLYLLVEKRDWSTADASRALARAFGVRDRDVGYAGQKDRRAVTTQWFSVHRPGGVVRNPDLAKRAPGMDVGEGILILQADWHANKLRLGHLRGNRFAIVVRDLATAPEEGLERASRVLKELSGIGLPNFFGEQRFGRDSDNAALGAALLGVGSHARLGRAKRDRHLRRLALSALQSELFNRCLSRRLRDGTWNRALEGDVLRRRDSGGLFVCESPEQEQPRLDSGELDVTGPMPGPRERPSSAGAARVLEDEVLAEVGLNREHFAKAGGEAEGTRRPFRIPLHDASVRLLADEALELSFTLPPGSYATRVLAEVMK